MSVYVIGDVHGCYVQLQQLLEKIDYNPDHDELRFVGDLVNRGPDSLQVLRFLKKQSRVQLVLGNHDFYLLIVGYDLMPQLPKPHSFQNILSARDRYDLLDWLRHQSLVLFDEVMQTAIVHAGIPPQWTIKQARVYGGEVEQALQGEGFQQYLADLFGDQPAEWSEQLSGQSRLRYITNALTRMRFCTQDGQLEFACHEPQASPAPEFRPWFEWRTQETSDICFGHWAALNGQCPTKHCHALDTGCVWGNALSAMRLDDHHLFSVSYHKTT